MDKHHLYFGSNLKLSKGITESARFAADICALLRPEDLSSVTAFIIPSYLAIPGVRDAIGPEGSLMFGAQNVCAQEQGAYTGETSVGQLMECGVPLVEIGHSERSHIYHETDEDCRKKAALVLEHGLRVLLCVGETAEEKAAGQADRVLCRQLAALEGLAGSTERIWVAYEPVWAIGTAGVPASPEYAQEKHAVIRSALTRVLGPAGGQIPLLYGGSVNPDNADALIRQPDIDGLFVGRAAWTAQGFVSLLRQARRSAGLN